MNKILVLIFGIFSLFVLAVSPAHAAILSLDPVSASSPVGQTFTVNLSINTEGESVTSTDAVLLYDDSILQVVNIVIGQNGQNAFFPDLFQNISPEEIYIGAARVILPVPKQR